jgi:AP-1 complex subunit mu
MEDVKFHQCVRLARFESDRTISFIPPDGEFELMSKVKGQFKRRSTANNVEIFVPVPDDADSPKFRVRRARGCGRRERSCAAGVDGHRAVRAGQVVLRVEDQAAWRRARLYDARALRPPLRPPRYGPPSLLLTLTDARADAESAEKRPPITVRFEIPYFTVSGIQVRYLKVVEKSGYQALPWVRYITQNGDDYSLRTALEKGSAPIVPM